MNHNKNLYGISFLHWKNQKKNRWIRKPPQISRQLTSSQHITKTMYSFVPIQPKRALNSIQGTFEAYLTPGILKSLVAQLPRFGSMTKIIGRQIFQSFQFYYLQQIIYWSLIRQWNGSAMMRFRHRILHFDLDFFGWNFNRLYNSNHIAAFFVEVDLI